MKIALQWQQMSAIATCLPRSALCTNPIFNLGEEKTEKIWEMVTKPEKMIRNMRKRKKKPCLPHQPCVPSSWALEDESTGSNIWQYLLTISWYWNWYWYQYICRSWRIKVEEAWSNPPAGPCSFSPCFTSQCSCKMSKKYSPIHPCFYVTVYGKTLWQ